MLKWLFLLLLFCVVIISISFCLNLQHLQFLTATDPECEAEPGWSESWQHDEASCWDQRPRLQVCVVVCLHSSCHGSQRSAFYQTAASLYWELCFIWWSSRIPSVKLSSITSGTRTTELLNFTTLDLKWIPDSHSWHLDVIFNRLRRVVTCRIFRCLRWKICWHGVFRDLIFIRGLCCFWMQHSRLRCHFGLVVLCVFLHVFLSCCVYFSGLWCEYSAVKRLSENRPMIKM